MQFNPLLIYGFEEVGGSSGESLWKHGLKTVTVTPHTAIKNGLLYSGNAVIDPRGLAPAGYHMPTRYELQEMLTYLGGDMGAGGKMKSADNWNAPNTGATNESGFNGFGGGCYVGGYILLGDQGRFWSNTQSGSAPYLYLQAMRLYNDSAYGVVYDTTNALDDACSIRFVKDNDTLGGNVTDQDGNIYHPVKIGNQVWLQENWACTKFANGEAITKGVAAGQSWYDYYDAVEANAFYLGAPISTEVNDPNHIRPKEDAVTVKAEYIDSMLWEQDVIETPEYTQNIKYGRLYNWYAANDLRSIAPSGWHVPTKSDYEILLSNYQTIDDAIIALLDSGRTHWMSENKSTNSSNFTILPSGHLINFYGYVGKGFDCKFLYLNGENNRVNGLHVNTYEFNWDTESDNTDGIGNDIYAVGKSIRLVKDDSVDEGSITIDGDVYDTVKIGNQIWLKQNLAVRHYQNGDLIGSDFSGIVGAVTAYNNDETNVYDTITTITTSPDPDHIRPMEGKKVLVKNIEGAATQEYQQIIDYTDGVADGDGVITGTQTFDLDPDIDTTKPMKVIDGSLFTRAYSINSAATPKTITMDVAPLAENDLIIYFYKL